MRYLLDTHIFIWYAKEQDRLSPDIAAILYDYSNELLLSLESVKELLVAYRVKPLLRKYWDSPIKMIESIQRQFGIRIIQPDMEVMRTMAKLEVNTAEDHNDPADHVHKPRPRTDI